MVSLNSRMLGYDQERTDRILRGALDRVRSMPGVESAAITTRTPLYLSFGPASVMVPGHHGQADQNA